MTLIIDWNGKQLNSNLSPVSFPMPASAPQPISELADNLILINTDNSPINQSSLIIISNQDINLKTENQSGQPIQLTTIFNQPFQISSSNMPGLADQAKTEIRQLFSASQLFFFPGYFLYLVFTRSIMLMFEVIIIFILFKVNRIHQKLIKLVQLGLHLFIPAEIVHQVSLRLIDEPPISFHSVTFWVLFLFIFFSVGYMPAKVDQKKS